uniref:Calcineurin-like phosphoesterase domain-containing protein n=1 Tax=Panagrolaimus sp. ES5 TaxID=591445 RepID=A0AC34FM84_9BILA
MDQEIWENYCNDGRTFEPIEKLISPTTPIKPNYIRFVCISDTHEKLDELLPKIPPGDVLIHCGDFTNNGDKDKILKFNKELETLPHKYKIVIAGNHEFGFEGNESTQEWVLQNPRLIGKGTDKGYKLLKNCIYLHDTSVKIYGIKIYGSPWHPKYGFSFFQKRGKDILQKWHQIPSDTDILLTHTPPLGHGDSVNVYGIKIYGSPWHSKYGFSFFQKRGKDILQKWHQIPSDTDILLTHTPPLGHGDSVNGMRIGCAELLNTVEKRVKPKYHIFGHVHENPGISTNYQTVFINAASVDRSRKMAHDPIVFDYPLPKGILKD